MDRIHENAAAFACKTRKNAQIKRLRKIAQPMKHTVWIRYGIFGPSVISLCNHLVTAEGGFLRRDRRKI